ncbi:ferritin-like domain-containing protein [Modestobacter sp. I12A-02628]|uniref:Ferritin-like domain-containing protein n=1 Tax=Goekera deserti TaxID=2497753 RepID=A0A7K3WGJ3_9ACTN|nr:ferritin-like domain-containing protein [Goekera deserti]MPQ96613.1 ferritin-like domain-containing protein [Goekera deserti]NDI47075.1 ferritin-like domain-containing protein [Goekera deserti]NEL55527.1 ferritin-like domain-containing protein [Goekera deserti]
MTDTSKLIAQLRALVLLTQTEEQVARTRTAQARTDAVRRELEQNADNARERTEALTEQLRRLGGVPDVVTPALGRLGAVVKATLEQAEPLDEALLQDLLLEHQLLDRATYLKVLAQTAEQPAVVALAERLVTAHRATVEWLTVVLAEEALGGPAALVATPFQRVAGGAARAANLPVRFLANTVNRALDTVQQAGEETTETITSVAGKAATFTGAVRESLTVGRNATLRRAERVAERQGDDVAADAVRATRREVGDMTAAEMPVKGYDSLSTTDAAKAVKALTSPADIRAMIRYEETHKKRRSVVNAAQTSLAALAKEAVGVSD